MISVGSNTNIMSYWDNPIFLKMRVCHLECIDQSKIDSDQHRYIMDTFKIKETNEYYMVRGIESRIDARDIRYITGLSKALYITGV